MIEQVKTITQTGKLIIGVTGNIATGKSAIMRLAHERGALTIDADKIVHALMDNDPNLQAALAVAFGPDIRFANGRINRRQLGQIVFNDPAALHDLEQMVHPAVRIAIATQVEQTENTIIFIEAIKLLEGPLASMCHQIWVTRCQKQRQLERLVICRGLDAETAAQRITVQPPQEEKVAQADVVIDTSGLMRDTEAQFDLYWERLPDPATAAPVQIHIPVDAGLAPPQPEATAPPPPAPRPPQTEAPIRLDRPVPKALKSRLGRKIERPARPPEKTAPATAVSPPKPALSPTHSQPSPSSSAPLVRRAKPSDVPAMLLLMHKATNGAVQRKRGDLLLALSERSYLIGQSGAEVQAVVGWTIENLIGRVTELYFYPPEVTSGMGTAVLASIEESAHSHMCEAIVIFLPENAPEALRHLVRAQGYAPADLRKLPPTWRGAIQESQPQGSSFVIKVLRERVTHPI